MSAPIKSSPEIAADMQALYDASLVEVLGLAKILMESTPAKPLAFMQYVHFSVAERIFILMQDVFESFKSSLDTGYFTSAALTRNMMESATILALLNRDKSGEVYSAFLEYQVGATQKRRSGLAGMTKAKSARIAADAASEAGITDRVLNALAQVRTHAKLPQPTAKFPDMLERCKSLGEEWEFTYHAVYRDLCESVHGSFLKSPHSPGHAFSSPNQGATLLYEHCRVMSHALEFWAFAMMECFAGHPDRVRLKDFVAKLSAFVDADARLLNIFPADARVLKISF